MFYLQAIVCTFLLLLCADCHVHYITSSENELCRADFCLTLSEFASNTSGYLYINTTLIFRSGYHVLDSIFTVSNIQFLQLMKSALVQTPTVQCEPSARFSFLKIGVVHVKELKFVSYSNNLVRLVQTFLLLDILFVGQENSSSALQLDKTREVERTSFVSYGKERSKQAVIWSPLPNYWSKFLYSYGALIVMHSTVTIMESIFEDNSAEIGGAALFKFSTVRIVESIFKHNIVPKWVEQ